MSKQEGGQTADQADQPKKSLGAIKPIIEGGKVIGFDIELHPHIEIHDRNRNIAIARVSTSDGSQRVVYREIEPSSPKEPSK